MGRLVAEGAPGRSIRIALGGWAGSCGAYGRGAVLISGSGETSVSLAELRGVALLAEDSSLTISVSFLDGVYIGLRNDSSTIEGCSLHNSPIYIYQNSTTKIQNCTISRDLPDEVGVRLASGTSARSNRISGCMIGVEAPPWVRAEVVENNITSCLDGVRSAGALSIRGNSIESCGVGINSTGGEDMASRNRITGNDVGIATMGDAGALMENTFETGGRGNRAADIQQRMLAVRSIVDGNGEELMANLTIRSSCGTVVYEGPPYPVLLTAYERLPGGQELRNAPFTASASLSGASCTTEIPEGPVAAFELALALLPELRVASLAGPPAGTHPGDLVTLKLSFRNDGPVPARGFDVVVTIDGRAALRRHINLLEPGVERSLEFGWVAEEGRHELTATVDTQSSVREGSEGDNAHSLTAVINGAGAFNSARAALAAILLLLAGVAAGALLLRKRPGGQGPGEKPVRRE
ncbi:MAG: CARDB domain-containing protein [Thermoplasmatota archaeon]